MHTSNQLEEVGRVAKDCTHVKVLLLSESRVHQDNSLSLYLLSVITKYYLIIL